MLKLFYAVGSCALASHIALEEAGAEYEAVIPTCSPWQGG
jgi:glutathione S-transferase